MEADRQGAVFENGLRVGRRRGRLDFPRRVSAGLWAAALLWTVAWAAGCGEGSFVRAMIYPAPRLAVGEPPPGHLSVRLPTGDETSVHGWHTLGADAGTGGVHASGRPVLLFFHGNGENLETMRRSGLLADLAALDAPYLLIDYPGYGRSDGTASETSTRRAAEAALSWLAREASDRPCVVVGWSLGAAVALRLAGDRPEEVAGVVAMSPWTSLAAVAETRFPKLVVRLLLSERYDSLAAAQRVRAPALVVHGLRDDLIPSAHGAAIAAALGDGARWVPVADAGHNDLLAREPVWRELRTFVDRISR